MCSHIPPCPLADAPDREAARTVACHPEQGWSLLCNGVVVFEDTGALLPDGCVIQPPRPAAGADPGPASWGGVGVTTPQQEPARQNGLSRPGSVEEFLQQVRAWTQHQNPSLQDLLSYPKWLNSATKVLLSLLATHPQVRTSVERHVRTWGWRG